MPQLLLHVPTMACRHCVRTVSAAVGDVPGVEAVVVDLDRGTVRIQGTAAPGAVRAALAAIGYPADA